MLKTLKRWRDEIPPGERWPVLLVAVALLVVLVGLAVDVHRWPAPPAPAGEELNRGEE